MAEIWAAAVVTAGVGLYAANKQAGAAKDAANASQQATQQSIAEQQREFNIEQQNLAPWLATGTAAENQLGAIMGLGGQAPDYSAFYSSPDYQFTLQQGQQALDRDAAARGSLYSGGHEADTMQFGQGLAAQQFGNYWNRLSSLAGNGQTTATNLGNAGMNMAGNIGNLLTNNAQNQTNSIYNSANAWTNFGNTLAGVGGNLIGNYFSPSSSSSSSGYGSSNPFYTGSMGQTGSFNSLTGSFG